MAPEAGFADRDQVGFAQIGQVPRDAGLRGKKHFHDVPHAQFPTLQDVENSQPCPVGKCPEHQVDAARYLSLCGVGHGRNQGRVLA